MIQIIQIKIVNHLIGQIKLINPDEFKEYIKIENEMCPKLHLIESKITVWRVHEKKIENSEETTTSNDLWFSTVVPFEISKNIDTLWGSKVEPA